jgi:membrane-bound serine protease (ClpP class)
MKIDQSINPGHWLSFIIFLLLALNVSAQGHSPKKVFVFTIDSEIDPRTNRYSELALDEAREVEADLVILELDTYGGAVNDADDIRTRILDFDIPIYVFINKDAASAGALISIACDSIYMAPGASIGAATVVVGTGEAAPDKYQSYMRSIMRSTAEAQGRDPKIAEAMVDQTIEIDTVSKAGQVLTLSTTEAMKLGFCEAEVQSIDEILERTGFAGATVVNFELSASEKVIRFFLNPVISGLLILIIIGGIYFELQTPGVGFPIMASIVAAILYFTPYYLNGLAENWEILAFMCGVVLLALEIFVIPGFGIAGISGIVLSIGALVLVMVNNDMFDFSFVDTNELLAAISSTIAGMIAAIIIMALGGARLANSQMFKRVALHDTQNRLEGYTSNFQTKSYLGQRGQAYTVLRPGGKVLIDGEILDAYTRGEFIDSGLEVEVIDESGTSLKVRKV